MRARTVLRQSALALAALLLGASKGWAAVHTWTGAVSVLWSDAGNWTGGSPVGDPAPDLVFGANALRFDPIDDLPGATAVRSLQFTGGAYDLGAAVGSTLTLQGDISVATGARARVAVAIGLTGSVTHKLAVVGGADLELAGPVSGGASDLLRPTGGPTGGGIVVLSANNGYGGATLVGTAGGAPDGVTTFVNGSQTTSAVTVLAGRLGGTGTVGPLTLDGGSLLGGGPGFLQPGGATAPGVLHVAGDAHLRAGEAGNIVRFRLNGPTEHDRLEVTGSVFLEAKAGPPTPTHPTLELTLSFVPAVGQAFTLVQSTGPLSGVFENGTDGAVFKAGCLDFRINYTANSVTVTRVAGAYDPFARFFTVTPCRLVDTRGANGPLGGPALPAGGVRQFQVAGSCQIPSTAKAVSANVTVTESAALGNLRIVGGGNPLPLTSVLNFGAGQTRANNLVAGWGCSPDKSLLVLNESTGPAHVILDLNGYFE